MGNRMFTNRLIWYLISSLLILLLVFPINMLLPQPVSAAGGTFPASPFNGMQITYNITGATITDTVDSDGFTTSRTLQGTLGTGQLTISGSAKMGNGYDADVTATVSCGGETDQFITNIPSGFPGFNEESFNISVPIPAGATSGSFSINMVGHYNAGNRGLVVSGTFVADAANVVTTSTQVTTQTQEDPPPGTLIDKLPDLKGTEGHRGYIEKIEGNPIYVSADSPLLPPSERKWVKFMPGDKNILLYDNWTVRTPSGAETVLRFSTGAVSRQKERSWFDVAPKVSVTPPTSEVMGRLWDGIANFYFPKGEAGAKQYEISLNRIHTGIKGTNFIVEVTEQMDLVKVIEGTVEVIFDKTGVSRILEAGQQISATEAGLGSVTSFDVEAEKAKWSSFYEELEKGISTWIWVVIVILLLAVIVLTLFILLRNRRKTPVWQQGGRFTQTYYQPTSKFCENCGSSLATNSNFCEKCGQPVYPGIGM
ncbi:MAG: FecR domain-containing protein [Dehalococcoidales bacterium]|nr:FecR domain-containing protein [Dehalococcoidales bacterium]